MKKTVILLIASIVMIPLIGIEAFAANPNLFVSAENPAFDNMFTGSQVVEVVIIDPNLRDTDSGKGEPDVTINGKKLRMVQASDGQWYAYFANVDHAKNADQIVFDAGVGAEGQSLDFGVFCSSSTDSSVLGTSFSQTRGVAIPRSGGVGDFTNGKSNFTPCTGSPTSSTVLNNVVRQSKSINTNSNIDPGQIGLDPDAWPIIQLFSFDDVEIKYNPGGGTQKTELVYEEMENILHEIDRTAYPDNAEVFSTITDYQLNQDPTAVDSWTFNINSTQATFYQAFNEGGSDSGNGGAGLINLVSSLPSLDFDNNGKVFLDTGVVAELKTNNHQPDDFVTDGSKTYSQILTFVESEPNTGVFESFDNGNISTLGILDDVPRGKTAIISYDSKSTSILTGSVTASINLDIQRSQFPPGQITDVTVQDIDQNKNPGTRDVLDVFRSSAIIPSLRQGSPVTLQNADDFKFYVISTDPLGGGISVPSSVPDLNSARLIIDTRDTSSTPFEKVSMDLGISAGTLHSLFIDVSNPDNGGTNWVNFDLRSFAEQLGINSFSDTSMTFHFGGLPGSTTVTFLDPGDMSSGKGFVQIDDSDIATINSVSTSSSVFLEVNFDSSDDSATTGSISNEEDTQPIVIDFFSFGIKNKDNVNNALYRFELKESQSNSGIFEGTVEYTVANQLEEFESTAIKTLRFIDREIKFAALEEQKDAKGVAISYADIGGVGVPVDTSVKSDIRTSSGVLSVSPNNIRFGSTVVLTVNDPDLNLRHDNVDVYSVVNDPNSPNVDTVGDAGGGILLEVLIKGIRYERCTIDGVEFGGLGATGFTLTETGPGTAIFEGSFKMPTEFCNKSGTEIITTAGGSLDAKYHDFRDNFGKPNIFSLLRSDVNTQQQNSLILNSKKFELPNNQETKEVILSGTIANYRPGTPLYVTLIGPDKSTKDLQLSATTQGSFKAVLTLQPNSKPGIYSFDVNYLGNPIGIVSFEISHKPVPDWLKNNARWWSANTLTDTEFLQGIEYLIQEEIIKVPDSIQSNKSNQKIPSWVKKSADWWSQDLVTDDEFLSALEFLVKNSIIRI